MNLGNQIVTDTHTFKHSWPCLHPAQSTAVQPISDVCVGGYILGRSYSKFALLCPEGFVCVCAPAKHIVEKVQVFLFAK